MAEAIQFTVSPPRLEMSAREEFERLLQTCHDQGVLRFLNDLVSSNEVVAKTLLGGLQKEGTLNVLQNLSILLMALSRVPPNQFYRLVFAAKDGVISLAGTSVPAGVDSKPPGLVGAYRMLHDEAPWKAMSPLLAALRVFVHGLQRRIDNPISDFSGKPGRSN